MKYAISLLSALLLLLLSLPLQAQTTRQVGNPGVAVVEVIDFHNAHRCRTCLTIENASKAELEKTFAAEVKAGKVVFRSIDVDDPKNAAIAERYEASGSALFVYNGKTGKAVDLTEFAFMHAMSNEAKLRAELKTHIQNALQ
jgi:hypothetical protein